ncbi:MAG TPA: hypothetical protein VMH82_06905 [Myxococcota bacterium]|nr:hypothetical protein [Myxococcota bacterium]
MRTFEVPLHRSRIRGIAVLVAALAALACAPTYVRTPVFKQDRTEIYLRHVAKGGTPVDRSFSHPVSISPVRLTNILARIEVRGSGDKDQRKPAIPTGVLYAIGEGASQALAKANSSQEVVVMAIERKRSLGIFTTEYATTLLIWAQDDKLFIQMDKLDEPISKDPNDKLAEPSEHPTNMKKLRVLAGDGLVPQTPLLIAATWRDDIFRDSAVRMRAGGEVIRRTILMETPSDSEAKPASGPAPPESLSPEALRALADLEETRRRGDLTEAEYQSRRKAILSGQIPAASAPASGAPADASRPAPQASPSTQAAPTSQAK